MTRENASLRPHHDPNDVLILILKDSTPLFPVSLKCCYKATRQGGGGEGVLRNITIGDEEVRSREALFWVRNVQVNLLWVERF